MTTTARHFLSCTLDVINPVYAGNSTDAINMHAVKLYAPPLLLLVRPNSACLQKRLDLWFFGKFLRF
jgi:hypothetical protein